MSAVDRPYGTGKQPLPNIDESFAPGEDSSLEAYVQRAMQKRIELSADDDEKAKARVNLSQFPAQLVRCLEWINHNCYVRVLGREGVWMTVAPPFGDLYNGVAQCGLQALHADPAVAACLARSQEAEDREDVSATSRREYFLFHVQARLHPLTERFQPYLTKSICGAIKEISDRTLLHRSAVTTGVFVAGLARSEHWLPEIAPKTLAKIAASHDIFLEFLQKLAERKVEQIDELA